MRINVVIEIIMKQTVKSVLIHSLRTLIDESKSLKIRVCLPANVHRAGAELFLH